LSVQARGLLGSPPYYSTFALYTLVFTLPFAFGDRFKILKPEFVGVGSDRLESLEAIGYNTM
jgi:hypothetical protein